MPSFLPSTEIPAACFWCVRLCLPLTLLILSAGCDTQDNRGPRTVTESLAELQATSKQLESSPAVPQSNTVAPLPAGIPDVRSTGTYKVKFETSAGDFVMEVHRDWAPIGADRFHHLVKAGFYDECRFFRVLPEFMVQFGINGIPNAQKPWESPLADDPRKESNQKGYVTFATKGPNSRTTQVFINYTDNGYLDSQGFSPFGQVIEGMPNVEAIFSEHGETPDQEQISLRGNEYLMKNFPKLDHVRKASIIEESAE